MEDRTAIILSSILLSYTFCNETFVYDRAALFQKLFYGYTILFFLTSITI